MGGANAARRNEPHVARMGHDRLVTKVDQLPAYPGGMRPCFQRDSTARNLVKDSVDSLRCPQETVLQNHFARLIQNAVAAGAVPHIQTDGEFRLLENLVPAYHHSANLFQSRSPFRCASSASIIGSVSHPAKTGPFIPSGMGLVLFSGLILSWPSCKEQFLVEVGSSDLQIRNRIQSSSPVVVSRFTGDAREPRSQLQPPPSTRAARPATATTPASREPSVTT